MKKSGLRRLFFRFPAPVGELFCEAFRPFGGVADPVAGFAGIFAQVVKLLSPVSWNSISFQSPARTELHQRPPFFRPCILKYQ